MLEFAIKPTQRAKNRQAQQPIRVHAGYADAVGIKPPAHKSVQVEVSDVKKQGGPTKDRQRPQQHFNRRARPRKQSQQQQIYPQGR